MNLNHFPHSQNLLFWNLFPQRLRWKCLEQYWISWFWIRAAAYLCEYSLNGLTLAARNVERKLALKVFGIVLSLKLSDNFIQGPSLQIFCDFFENFYNSSVMVKFCGKSWNYSATEQLISNRWESARTLWQAKVASVHNNSNIKSNQQQVYIWPDFGGK